MAPETKAWIDDLKKFYKEDVHEQTSHTLAFMNLPKAIQIIESQDKEIERMKDVLLLVLSDGDFYVGKEREWIGTKTAYMLRKVFGL